MSKFTLVRNPITATIYQNYGSVNIFFGSGTPDLLSWMFMGGPLIKNLPGSGSYMDSFGAIDKKSLSSRVGLYYHWRFYINTELFSWNFFESLIKSTGPDLELDLDPDQWNRIMESDQDPGGQFITDPLDPNHDPKALHFAKSFDVSSSVGIHWKVHTSVNRCSCSPPPHPIQIFCAFKRPEGTDGVYAVLKTCTCKGVFFFKCLAKKV